MPNDRLRQIEEEDAAGRLALLKWDLRIFAVHIVLVVLILGTVFFIGVSIIDYVLGFISGIGLYSLFWRWRYGFWPNILNVLEL